MRKIGESGKKRLISGEDLALIRRNFPNSDLFQRFHDALSTFLQSESEAEGKYMLTFINKNCSGTNKETLKKMLEKLMLEIRI